MLITHHEVGLFQEIFISRIIRLPLKHGKVSCILNFSHLTPATLAESVTVPFLIILINEVVSLNPVNIKLYHS